MFFLLDLVPQIDLSPFHQYSPRASRPTAFDVTMMVPLLVTPLRRSLLQPKDGGLLRDDLAFRAVVVDDPPDFRTISDFRNPPGVVSAPVPRGAAPGWRVGYRQAWNLSTDGTKMGANASRHKTMSYGYMDKEIQRLEAEIEQLLKQAEQLDAEQDAALEAVVATNCPTN